MKTSLVIVESPGKIKKLNAILGAGYQIIASMGHVVDLPPKAFGIDLATMQPDYVVMKADVAKRIRAEAAKGYPTIYLCSDPDREGEAIAHHIAGLLRKAKTSAKLLRVTFDAITPSAVQAAFAKPRPILQDAAESLKVIFQGQWDRLEGWLAKLETTLLRFAHKSKRRTRPSSLDFFLPDTPFMASDGVYLE